MSSVDESHILDPTLKVKAPDSILNKLGNLYVNLKLTEAKLYDNYMKLITPEHAARVQTYKIEVDKTQPRSVIEYLTACQNMAYNIDMFSNKMAEVIGGFEWDDQGALIRLT